VRAAGVLAIALTLLPLAPAEASSSMRGTASWYCKPGVSVCARGYPAGGRYAAACPTLRRLLGSSWRQRTVLVSRGSRRVRARLVDTCTSRIPGRLIDLYAGVFDDLAPLRIGVIGVTVTR
jgi:hypothetical protein